MTSRVFRALSAFTLFVGAVSLLPAGAGAAAARSQSQPVQVGIGQVSPQVPDFTDIKKTMTFSGTLHNAGSSALKGAHIEILRSEVTSRSQMGSANGQGNFVSNSLTKVPNLAPNTSSAWKLTPTEEDLFGYDVPSPGVYAIDVDVVDSDNYFVGGQRTYVVWNPKEQHDAKVARIALMWPVVGQPGLTGQKKPDNTALPILSDQSAAQQFAPDGRLSRVLQDADGLTVNWLLDPDVLYTAQELSNGYFYPDPQNPDGPPIGAQSTSTGDAGSWYARASTTVAQTQNCWNLLYGDPDLNTLSRTKPGEALLNAAAIVQRPITTGGCRQAGPTVAWPSGGQADTTTLNAIAGTKASNLVTLVGSNEVSVWPSAHASLPNSPNTVVYDNYLSALFAAPAKSAQPSLSNAGVLAGQQWLAQTALADKDNTDRVLVVTPPRDFDPAPELLAAIKASSVPTKSQWFGLDSLNQALSAPATPQRTSALTKISTPNLPDTVVDQASDSNQLYGALHTIIVGKAYDAAVPYRPVATWWRGQPGVQAYSKTVYDTAVSDHALVSFGSQTPPLTMSGKSGTVPVTVKNQTNATIRVYLGVHTSHSVDLKATSNQGAHTVDSGLSATIRIPVQGRGNGDKVTLTAELYTCPTVTESCAYYPSGLLTNVNPAGGTTEVTVKVSRIGIIALALMIGSGVLLIVLIGLRVLRAKRTHHAPAQDTMAS